MSILRFDVEYPDGRRESLHVDSERVVIGSAAHCDLRLASEPCAPEHAVIEILGEIVRVEARAFEPPVLLDGAPIRRASLLPGAVLAIGGVSIRVVPGDRTFVAKTEGGAVTPLRLVIAALALSAVALVALRPRGEGAARPTGVPELWGALSRQCPVTSPAQARALAIEKRVVADGKRERHPFYLAEGVEAVGLYTTAAGCFQAAGEAALENELDTVARQLRAEVDQSYRVRRLRLERALTTGENEIAGAEVIELRALTMGKQGAYVDWLNTVARKLNVDKDVQ